MLFYLFGNRDHPWMLHEERQQRQRGLPHVCLIAAHSAAQRAQQPVLHGLPDVLRPLPHQLAQQLQGFPAGSTTLVSPMRQILNNLMDSLCVCAMQSGLHESQEACGKGAEKDTFAGGDLTRQQLSLGAAAGRPAP